MGISQRGNGELQVQADNYLTELEANPVWIEHDLPLVPSYDSPMSTDPSFHNRPNYSTFYPNDRTGQQPLAKSSSIEDAKGMERIKQISCYLHSNQMNIFGNSGGDIIMPRFAFVSNPGQRNQFQPDTKALMINILPEEERRNFINKSKSIHPENKGNEETEHIVRHEVENVFEEEAEIADNFQEDRNNLVIPPKLETFDTKDQMQDEVKLGFSWFWPELKTRGYEAEEKVLKNSTTYHMQYIDFAHKQAQLKIGVTDPNSTTYHMQYIDFAHKQAQLKIGVTDLFQNNLDNNYLVGIKTTPDEAEEKTENIRAYYMHYLDFTHIQADLKMGGTYLVNLIFSWFRPGLKTRLYEVEEISVMNSTTYHMQYIDFAHKQAQLKIRVTDLVKNATADRRSNHESTNIKLYRNIIRNETGRMMISIDTVETEAEHLFGLERSWIFFDLLDDKLFYFGPARAVSDIIPNMAKSDVRQHVISFVDLVCDMMNRLMTLLLGCLDSKRLQQMPEQDFISLMQSVIDSSLKSKIKEGKKLSLKGSTLIMVDSEEFERALGEEIPKDVLDRLRHGDEMVAHRFVDTRLERTRTTERRENRLIHSIYFPSDCRLFIYIPTLKESYWHQLDMKRANRIRQQGK